MTTLGSCDLQKLIYYVCYQRPDPNLFQQLCMRGDFEENTGRVERNGSDAFQLESG